MDAPLLARPGSGTSDVSLTAGVVAAVRASRSDSTRRVYDCYTRQWADWCAARGISAQSAGPVEVSAWLQAMHGAGASPATVRTARAALSHHHRTLAMLLAAGGGEAEIAAALRWDDLTIEDDGSGRLTVRRSKTAQARGLPAEPHSPMWGRPLHPSTVGRIVTRRAGRRRTPRHDRPLFAGGYGPGPSHSRRRTG